LGRREAELMAHEIATLNMADNTDANRSPNRQMTVKEITDALPEFDSNGGVSPSAEVFIRRVSKKRTSTADCTMGAENSEVRFCC
jgi:hypothetical protein